MRTLKLMVFAAMAISAIACGSKEELDNTAPKKSGEKTVYPGNNPNRKLFDSDLFEKYTDESGVVSYQLKSGLGGWECSQSNYFNTRSMTNDEKFLFYFGSNKDFPTRQSRCGMIVDLRDGTVYKIKGCSFSCCPYLDIENDVLYYATVNESKTGATFYKRNLLEDPSVAIKLVNLPSRMLPAKSRPIKKLCTHLTLTQDKSKVFLDMRLYDTFLWGLLDLKTGAWERWTPDNMVDEGNKIYSDVNLTHGQLNPKNDAMALMATDHYTLTEKVNGESVTIPIYKDADGWYPRIQIVQKNSRMTMIPDPYSEDPDKKDGGYASHERWHEDGNYVYWCSGKPCIRSLANARNKDSYTKYSDALNCASHCFFSKDFFTSTDKKWITYDDQSYQYQYYRSCNWRVHFYNHKTKKTVMIYTLMPYLISKTEINADSDLKQAYQNWHTDPHPQFVCNDKYIVCTVQKTDKTIRLSITPVDQLVTKTK